MVTSPLVLDTLTQLRCPSLDKVAEQVARSRPTVSPRSAGRHSR